MEQDESQFSCGKSVDESTRQQEPGFHKAIQRRSDNVRAFRKRQIISNSKTFAAILQERQQARVGERLQFRKPPSDADRTYQHVTGKQEEASKPQSKKDGNPGDFQRSCAGNGWFGYCFSVWLRGNNRRFGCNISTLNDWRGRVW